MAGTCRMKGSANCCLDNGECSFAPVRRRSTVAGPKIAAVERREARVPGNNGTRHLQKVPDLFPAPIRRSAPSRGEGRKRTADPTPTKQQGQ